MIRSKLNSQKGATLLFALVALAVAVIVCAVVIYAAQSSAGRIRSAQAAEQTHLTLNSAASVIRDQLAGNGIKVSNTYTTVTRTSNGLTTETKNPGVVSIEYSDTDRSNVKTILASGNQGEAGTTAGLSYLQRMLLNWTLDVMTGSATTTNACYAEYTVCASGPDGSLDDIEMKVRLEPGKTPDLVSQDAKESHEAEKYYLTIVLSAKGKPSETITMSFMATVSESTSSKLVSKTSSTVAAGDGSMISVSEKVVKTEQLLELYWLEPGVVVNVANKKGDLT